jgi:hypothetical protein
MFKNWNKYDFIAAFITLLVIGWCIIKTVPFGT